MGLGVVDCFGVEAAGQLGEALVCSSGFGDIVDHERAGVQGALILARCEVIATEGDDADVSSVQPEYDDGSVNPGKYNLHP